MRVHAGLAGALAALALAVAAGSGSAQQPLPPDPMGAGGQRIPGASSRTGRQTQIPSAPNTMPMPSADSTQMARQQNQTRQKELVEDTDKLLLLAQELKANVDKTTKDTLSMDVVRKAEEIEKLAHSVKEKMRN